MPFVFPFIPVILVLVAVLIYSTSYTFAKEEDRNNDYYMW